jgi:DnaK suppressor protein
MSSLFNENQLAAFHKQLQERREAVVDELRRVLMATDEEHYAELAGRVHDSAEAAVADLLADLDLAETHRLVTELQDIDAARRRLTDGSYGICSDCSEPVGVERLSAYPVAKRCIDCQKKYEAAKQRSGEHLPSL